MCSRQTLGPFATKELTSNQRVSSFTFHNMPRFSDHDKSSVLQISPTAQVNELNLIRQSLYDLEAQYGKVRQNLEV
jgi:Tup N-terminal